MENNQKVCNSCNILLSLDNFTKGKNQCKKCRNTNKVLKYNKDKKPIVLITEKTVEMDCDDVKYKNLLEFIKEQNYSNFKINNWFFDIWIPLSSKKMVLITPDLLSWMGFSSQRNNKVWTQIGPPTRGPICVHTYDYDNKQQLHFIRFLDENNLPFIEIDHKDKRCLFYSHIQKDIEILKTNKSDNNLKNRRWILMETDIFKESVMMLSTKNSREVRKYYITIEKIFFDYLTYLNEKKLKEKDCIINSMQNSQLIMKNFIENVKSKSRNGYIYIATSKNYAAINNFKVGKTDKPINIRESGFNNSRIEQDRFYICFYKKVYSSDKVERLLHELLDSFRDVKNKEIFIIHYTYLKELVELTIENMDRPFEYINNLIKNKLVGMYNLRPIIPKEIEIHSDEKLLLEDIKNQIYSILDKAIEENNLNISKKELFQKINLEINPGNVKLWNIIKEHFSWKSSKIPIKYKDKDIIIKY